MKEIQISTKVLIKNILELIISYYYQFNNKIINYNLNIIFNY